MFWPYKANASGNLKRSSLICNFKSISLPSSLGRETAKFRSKGAFTLDAKQPPKCDVIDNLRKVATDRDLRYWIA